MRTLLPLAAVVAVLGVSAPAQAQFANKSFTVAPGYLATAQDMHFDGAIPLFIGGTLYLEAGWELYSRFPIALLKPIGQGQPWVFGWGNNTGFRYLLAEDLLRPYIGAHVSFLQILDGVQPIYVGPGASLGVDYFLNDSVSLGVQGQADLFLSLTEDPRPSYAVTLNLGFWFN